MIDPAERIASESARLGQLLSGIKGLSRSGALSPEPLDLCALLKEVVALWEVEAGQREIDLEIDAADDVPCVRADYAQIRRVVDNLVKNALEAVERGPGRVTLGAAARDAHVAITITDTGPGLSNEDDLFRLFATTKEDGSGLGLVICRQIVEAHEGRIRSVSRDEGAAFEIVLPVDGPTNLEPRSG